jgi:hypothetical protein
VCATVPLQLARDACHYLVAGHRTMDRSRDIVCDTCRTVIKPDKHIFISIPYSCPRHTCLMMHQKCFQDAREQEQPSLPDAAPESSSHPAADSDDDSVNPDNEAEEKPADASESEGGEEEPSDGESLGSSSESESEDIKRIKKHAILRLIDDCADDREAGETVAE